MNERVTRIAQALRLAWSREPLWLFGNGAKGAWYDPSDMSTLFQDQVTPVTAMEQFVGIVLDKSLGGIRGPENIVNGDFRSEKSGWFESIGSYWTVANGRATFPTGLGLRKLFQDFTLTGVHELTVNVNVTLGTMLITAKDSANVTIEKALGVGNHDVRIIFMNGVNSVGFTRGGPVTNMTGSIGGVSLRSVPGKHLYQPTSAARPKLSARMNLFPVTEPLFGYSSPVESTADVPPGTGVSKSYLITITALSNLTMSVTAPSASVESVFYIKAGNVTAFTFLTRNSTTSTNLGAKSLNTVTGVASAGITALGDGWFKVVLPQATGFSPGQLLTIYFGATSGFPAGATVRLAGASCVDASAANYTELPYQFVRGPTDYDTTVGKAQLHFDGIDDFMTVPDSKDHFIGLHDGNGMTLASGSTKADSVNLTLLSNNDPLTPSTIGATWSHPDAYLNRNVTNGTELSTETTYVNQDATGHSINVVERDSAYGQELAAYERYEKVPGHYSYLPSSAFSGLPSTYDLHVGCNAVAPRNFVKWSLAQLVIANTAPIDLESLTIRRFIHTKLKKAFDV